jgi:hypothetical protein
MEDNKQYLFSINWFSVQYQACFPSSERFCLHSSYLRKEFRYYYMWSKQRAPNKLSSKEDHTPDITPALLLLCGCQII